MLPFLYETKESAVTFAKVGDGASFLTKLADIGPLLPTERDTAIDVALKVIGQPDIYRDVFGSAEKNLQFAENAFSRDLTREEAYDRRIKAVKDATGIALENPERWGYQQDAKRAVRNDLMASGGQGIDETGGIPAYRRRIFDQKLSELRSVHPDKSADLTFGNIDQEAHAISRGAEADYIRAKSNPDLDPAASLIADFAGAMWGMRRDPLMVGSLFFGPTSAAGKAVIARVASAGLFQGLYNAGLSAIEQPAVQAWRDEVGLKSGVVPALENVGLAFLFGAIPGAAFRGIHEAARAPVKRVLEGRAEPGDAEAAIKAVGGEVSSQEAGAIKLGEEMDAAERVTRPPAPKDIAPELHDNLTTAAQRYADDPVNQPSPAAVGFIEAYHGSPHDFEAFSLDKIGTGEGAQSYGHGLYFAENKAVAGTYAERVFKDQETAAHREARYWLEHRNNGDRKAAIADLQEKIDSTRKDLEAPGTYKAMTDAKGLLEGGWEPPATGNEYQVRIHADREHFLDWDKPLSEQSPEVREALSGLGVKGGNNLGSVIIDHLAHNEFPFSDVTGGPDYAAVSAALREAGIPGIKYLDQGSRGGIDEPFIVKDKAGREILRTQDETHAAREAEKIGGTYESGPDTRTSNFVLFDDKLVEITHKNDSPLAREVGDRVAEANPQTKREAQMAASEAIEDIGNRETMARTRAQMEAERFTLEETFDQDIKPAPRSKDTLDKIPMIRDDGTPTLVSARQAARAGERETQFADLIRECK